jgi:ribosomal protein L18E
LGLFKKEVKQDVKLTEEELRKWREAARQASEHMWKLFRDSLDKPASSRPVIRFYPNIADLVDALIRTEEISGELLGRIGRVLGDRWRDENGDN